MRIKACAKVNIFLKITGIRGNYHTLRSRFIRIETLYDTLSFEPKKEQTPSFELTCSDQNLQNNIVTKAYHLLKSEAPIIEKFFTSYQVVLKKRVPKGAGLGGGSSDAAAFLNLCNDVCALKLSKEKLSQIGEKIGADVPFFIYGYPSANVEGIGEVITPFEEDLPALELLTPPIHCDTASVYQTFRTSFIDRIDPKAAKEWLQRPTTFLLQQLDPMEANDLYPAALKHYPTLLQYRKPKRFFSGSGSSFFYLK